jgi:hypothetical protein
MRWRSALLTVYSAVALAACGGDGMEQVDQQTVTGPTIERAVADRLATRSDNVANLLDAGDACAAQEEAAALEQDFRESVDEIPELYLEDLGSAIHEIVAAVPPCEPPPPTETDEEEEDEERKGKGKGRDGGDGDD